MGKVIATSISKKDENLLILYVPTALVEKIDDLLTFFMNGTSVDGDTAVFNINDLVIENSKTGPGISVMTFKCNDMPEGINFLVQSEIINKDMAASIDATWVMKESQQIETHNVKVGKK